MSVSFYLKRSATPSKRPLTSGIALGELALNYDSATGGLYYKDSTASIVKVGSAQVSSSAPNSSPAGSSGNSVGEFWYDTMTSALKVWDGSAWVATNTNLDYVDKSAYTAKGVLLVGSAPNTPIALAVGTDGYVLVADSAEASGLKWVAGGGGGSVTSITAGTGLTGGTITTTGTIALDTSGVSAGAYTFASITVDAYGRVTVAANGSDATTSAKGIVQVGTNLDVAAGVISVADGSSAAKGVLQVGTNLGVAAGVVSVADASTSTKGVVQLATNAEVQAGTDASNAVVSSSLQSKLSDSTSTTSSSTIASSTAVKSAYDLANGKVTGVTGTAPVTVDNTDPKNPIVGVNTGTTSATGVLQLTDSTSSTSATTAATPNAVKTTFDLAAAALPKAVFTAKGDIISGTGSATFVALPVGTNGHILSADSTTASGLSWISVSGSGTVTSITAGTGLTGGTITTSGTIALANTAVTAGSYTNSSFTVDAQGRLTAASSGTTQVTSVTATSPITSSGGTTPVISTSMATNKLLGRSTAGTGVAEEITVGTNLTLSAGTLAAPAFATTAEMQGFATTATATSGATTITVASGTGIANGDSVYGFGIVPGTTVVSGGGTTSIVLDTGIVNTVSATSVTFNTNQTIVTPGDTGAGLAKAWVRWQPNTTSTWPGGTSTVFRASGSNTATITGANNHGLNVGSKVYVLTGVIPLGGGFTVVSVPTPKTFTITTTTSSLLNNVAITFYFATISTSYNIHSIFPSSGVNTDHRWFFNFTTPQLNTVYVTFGLGNSANSAQPFLGVGGQTQQSFNMAYFIGSVATAPGNTQNVVVFG